MEHQLLVLVVVQVDQNSLLVDQVLLEVEMVVKILMEMVLPLTQVVVVEDQVE